MLTLFAIPKHFRGHFATIQRNAIESWTRLSPRPEILLFGEEEGAAEIAGELNVQHIPQVARNEFGTPLVSDLFRQAELRSSSPMLAYVNSDIVLTGEFSTTADFVRSRFPKVLMVGRRWDLDWNRPISFEQPDWADAIRSEALRADKQRNGNSIDYFLFSRGVFGELPPLAIGRFTWDNYLIWKARSGGAELVDVSSRVIAIHQNHDYSHFSDGKADISESPERWRNRELAGPWWCLYTIDDATQILTAEGLRPSRLHTWLMVKRCWSHPLTIVQWPWYALRRLVRA